jgi:hypothetical protein
MLFLASKPVTSLPAPDSDPFNLLVAVEVDPGITGALNENKSEPVNIECN